ncbi:MAG: M20/M25/M40 family metallo-hydrolase, partial [Halobacteriovoraceae bacterium]|nr:M20/M25/M40 family metallo-hydrolase [Halobacteriovoraceae bacterium]
KGGSIVIIKGIQDFLGQIPNPSFNFQVVISPNEEPGSPGWHDRFQQIGKTSPILLGFEPAMEEGDLIGGRRGNTWYQIRVYGISGHTGREGRESTNAAHELAAKIVKINQLEKLSPDISLNVSALQTTSDRFNIICDYAGAQLDFRFNSFYDRDRLHPEIISIINKPQINHSHGRNCYSVYSIEDDCPPLEYGQNSHQIGEFYKDLINNIEKTSFKVISSGGAADINYMATAESITLDGLGPIGGNLHTPDEFILSYSLLSRSEALTKFLMALEQKKINILNR